jgi:hypothetical protein
MAPGTKRQSTTFKPPRPKTAASTSKASKASKTSKSKETAESSRRISKQSSLSSSTSSIQSNDDAPSPEPDFILAELVPDEPEDDTPKIPEKLVSTLLNNSFQDKDKTKINKEAAKVMGKYVEIFVREALARSAFARGERERESGGIGDGFLEVEDLERMAQQMVLDF